MTLKIIRLSVIITSAMTLLSIAIPAVALAADLTKSDLLAALQSGGNVVYIRHASTEKDYADQITAIMDDCGTQRSLSEAGWHEARAIGAAFVLYNIPVGQVFSSQYCRAWQTADLAFGRYQKSADFNFEPAEEYTPEQIETMRSRVQPYFEMVQQSGQNMIIVGHDDPFEAVSGIYPEPMGVAYVIRPDGKGDFTILGHLAPDDWLASPIN